MLLSGGVHLSAGSVPPLTCRYLLGRAWSGVFCLIFLEVVTIHTCHYLYCAALWLPGALQLHKPWPDVCECVAALSSEPAAHALPLCHSPLQPNSLAGAHYLLHPHERYNLPFFSFVLKRWSQEGTLGNLSLFPVLLAYFFLLRCLPS